MNYSEFNDYIEINDNKFVKKFKSNDDHIFYIEPAFYTQLMGLFERYPEQQGVVLNYMYKLIKENKAIAFVYDFENPFLDYKDAILREFVDITDAVKVFYDDKSRGSDYGD